MTPEERSTKLANTVLDAVYGKRSRMTDYEALKAYGHSPAKAAEIVLDAKRGDGHCLRWIELVQSALAKDGEQPPETRSAIYSDGREL